MTKKLFHDLKHWFERAEEARRLDSGSRRTMLEIAENDPVVKSDKGAKPRCDEQPMNDWLPPSMASPIIQRIDTGMPTRKIAPKVKVRGASRSIIAFPRVVQPLPYMCAKSLGALWLATTAKRQPRQSDHCHKCQR
jgi:hypothetical protein